MERVTSEDSTKFKCQSFVVRETATSTNARTDVLDGECIPSRKQD